MAKTYKVELELTADELDYIEDVWYYDSRDQKTTEQILKYKVYYAIGDYIK